MADRTKIFIIKFLIVTGVCLLLMLFPFMIPVALLWPQFINIYFRIVLFTLLGEGAILIICMCTFKVSLSYGKKKAEKIPHPISKNDSIEVHFHTVLTNREYTHKQMLWNEDDTGSINIYYKTTGLWEKSCFCVIRTREISNEILAIANDAITDVLGEHDTKQITDAINMTLLCCVDRINESFNRLINDGVQQGLKNRRFIVGYSYGGQKIYLSPPKNSIGILQYKKLKRRFLKMLSCQEKK